MHTQAETRTPLTALTFAFACTNNLTVPVLHFAAARCSGVHPSYQHTYVSSSFRVLLSCVYVGMMTYYVYLYMYMFKLCFGWHMYCCASYLRQVFDEKVIAYRNIKVLDEKVIA